VEITRELDKESPLYCYHIYIIYTWSMLLNIYLTLKSMCCPWMYHILWDRYAVDMLLNVIHLFLSQTSFSMYLHNKWTDFHILSCTGKPQIRVICTYVGCTKVTINNWDIRPLVAVKGLSVNISWTAKQVCMIELVLESAHQSVYNNIWYISK